MMIEDRQKVLVTGAKGMLGWALTKELSLEYQLIGIDIEDADITDENQIKEEIFNIHPEIVIHTAAYTEVDNCEKNKELTHRVNAIGAGNVARACKLCHAKLICISTDFVFDGTKNSPYTEEDTPNPINTYGKSKLEGERQLQTIYPNNLIIRTSWLYGPRGRNFVDKIIQLAENQTETKVINDQTGSPTYTIDLARAINTLIKKNLLGIINVTNTGSCTWFEFAEKTLELAKKSSKLIPITSNQLDRLAKRPSFSVLSTEKFQNITQTRLRPWREALAEYISRL